MQQKIKIKNIFLLLLIVFTIQNIASAMSFNKYLYGNSNFGKFIKQGSTLVKATYKIGLRKNINALEALNSLRSNTNLANKLPNKTLAEIDELLGNMKGWGEGTTSASYKQVCDKVNELLDELPNNVSNLEKYLGSAGFGNANNYTNRHSWVQLERLLENKQKLSLADEIIFESPCLIQQVNSFTLP